MIIEYEILTSFRAKLVKWWKFQKSDETLRTFPCEALRLTPEQISILKRDIVVALKGAHMVYPHLEEYPQVITSLFHYLKVEPRFRKWNDYPPKYLFKAIRRWCVYEDLFFEGYVECDIIKIGFKGYEK